MWKKIFSSPGLGRTPPTREAGEVSTKVERSMPAQSATETGLRDAPGQPSPPTAIKASRAAFAAGAFREPDTTVRALGRAAAQGSSSRPEAGGLRRSESGSLSRPAREPAPAARSVRRSRSAPVLSAALAPEAEPPLSALLTYAPPLFDLGTPLAPHTLGAGVRALGWALDRSRAAPEPSVLAEVLEAHRDQLAGLPSRDRLGSSETRGQDRLDAILGAWSAAGRNPRELVPQAVRDAGYVNVRYEYQDQDVSKLLEQRAAGEGVHLYAPVGSRAELRATLRQIAQQRRRTPNSLHVVPANFAVGGPRNHWTSVLVRVGKGSVDVASVDTLLGRTGGLDPVLTEAASALGFARPSPLTHGRQSDTTSCGPLMVHDTVALVNGWQASRDKNKKRLPTAVEPADVLEVRRADLETLRPLDAQFEARQLWAQQAMAQANVVELSGNDALRRDIFDALAAGPVEALDAFLAQPTVEGLRGLAPELRLDRLTSFTPAAFVTRTARLFDASRAVEASVLALPKKTAKAFWRAHGEPRPEQTIEVVREALRAGGEGFSFTGDRAAPLPEMEAIQEGLRRAWPKRP